MAGVSSEVEPARYDDVELDDANMRSPSNSPSSLESSLSLLTTPPLSRRTTERVIDCERRREAGAVDGDVEVDRSLALVRSENEALADARAGWREADAPLPPPCVERRRDEFACSCSCCCCARSCSTMACRRAIILVRIKSVWRISETIAGGGLLMVESALMRSWQSVL